MPAEALGGLGPLAGGPQVRGRGGEVAIAQGIGAGLELVLSRDQRVARRPAGPGRVGDQEQRGEREEPEDDRAAAMPATSGRSPAGPGGAGRHAAHPTPGTLPAR